MNRQSKLVSVFSSVTQIFYSSQTRKCNRVCGFFLSQSLLMNPHCGFEQIRTNRQFECIEILNVEPGEKAPLAYYIQTWQRIQDK